MRDLVNGFGTARRHVANSDSRVASPACRMIVHFALILDPSQTLWVWQSRRGRARDAESEHTANPSGKSLTRVVE